MLESQNNKEKDIYISPLRFIKIQILLLDIEVTKFVKEKYILYDNFLIHKL